MRCKSMSRMMIVRTYDLWLYITCIPQELSDILTLLEHRFHRFFWIGIETHHTVVRHDDVSDIYDVIR